MTEILGKELAQTYDPMVQVTQTIGAAGEVTIIVGTNMDASTPHLWQIIGDMLNKGVRAAAIEEAKALLKAEEPPMVRPYQGLDALAALGIKH